MDWVSYFFTVLLWVWKTSVVVQWLSRVQLFATLCTAAHQASLPFTISWSSLKPMSNELMTPYNHSSLLPPSSPALNLSQPQGLFQCIGSKHRVALHWLRGHVYLSCGVLLVPYPPERSLHLQFYRNHMQLLLSWSFAHRRHYQVFGSCPV